MLIKNNNITKDKTAFYLSKILSLCYEIINKAENFIIQDCEKIDKESDKYMVLEMLFGKNFNSIAVINKAIDMIDKIHETASIHEFNLYDNIENDTIEDNDFETINAIIDQYLKTSQKKSIN